MSRSLNSDIFAMLFVVTLALAGCTTTNDKGYQPWQKKDFLNLCFILDDANEIEQISFSSDHRMAAVTFGEQRGDYFKECAPLMCWRLRNGKLQIYDHDNRVYTTWTFLRRENNVIYVLNERNETRRYRNE
jgi:hypothetical protein